jgi:hypothetical protein
MRSIAAIAARISHELPSTSATTTEPKAPPAKTGTPHGELGLQTKNALVPECLRGKAPALTGTEPLPLLKALTNWQPMYDPPGTKAELSMVSSALQRGLVPASPLQYQQAERDLKTWMKGFGIQSADPEAVLMTYRKTLAHLPPDLLALAVERVIAKWKWGSKPPMPADILDTVSEEMGARTMLAYRARTALTKATLTSRHS